MLVSVLVDRYQRVYSRKHFLNEEYSENIVLDNSFSQLNNHDISTGGQIDTKKQFNTILQCNEKIDEKKDNDEPSGKVRFIIGYVSDDDDNDQDKIDGNKNYIINKVAQELLKSTSKMYRSNGKKL